MSRKKIADQGPVPDNEDVFEVSLPGLLQGLGLINVKNIRRMILFPLIHLTKMTRMMMR